MVRQKKSILNEYGKLPLSSYEADCMWMSYRYCIGRHTIASYAHAYDIAQNCYKRMSHDRMEFTASDIRKECSNILSWTYNFRLENENKDLNHIFDIFGHMINDLKIDDEDRLKVCINILKNSQGVVGWVDEDNKYRYDLGNKKTNEKYDEYASFIDYEDLMQWQYIANLFDIDSHHIAHTEHYGDIEFFYITVPERTQYNEGYRTVQKMIPVDAYLNQSQYVVLDEKIVKSID